MRGFLQFCLETSIQVFEYYLASCREIDSWITSVGIRSSSYYDSAVSLIVSITSKVCTLSTLTSYQANVI
jgi:hypothetical protein